MVFRLRYFNSRNQDKRQTNRGGEELAWTKINTKYPNFIGFANFYWRFIQGFSRVAITLILILKTTRLSKKLASKASRADSNKVVRGVSNRTDKIVKNLPLFKTHVPNIGATEEFKFLAPSAKKAFKQLKLAFTNAPVL